MSAWIQDSIKNVLKAVWLGLILCCAFVWWGCNDTQAKSPSGNDTHFDESALGCDVKAFGAYPPLNVLLQLLYPEGMIGLNYTPYKEDLPFMLDSVKSLPVLGHLGDNSLSFEQIATLKPSVIFVNQQSGNEKLLAPYKRLGIEIVELNAYSYEDLAKNIELYAKALSVSKPCSKLISQRAEKLLGFVQNANALLEGVYKNLPAKRVKIYFAQGYDGLKTQCMAQKEQDLAHYIGGENALFSRNLCQDSLKQQTLDFEQLLSLEPDVIFVREVGLYRELKKLMNADSSTNQAYAKWLLLKALKDKKVYYAPSTPSNWLMRPPSIMQVVGYIWATSKLYPELLPPQTAEAFIQDFFVEFLQPLSHEQYEALQN